MVGDLNIEDVQKNDFRHSYADFDFNNDLYTHDNHNCQYFEEDEFQAKVERLKNDNFSILSLNIQSLNSKFSEFKTFLANSCKNFKPSIICLQETWTNPIDLNLFKLDDYHLPYIEGRGGRQVDRLTDNGIGGRGRGQDDRLTDSNNIHGGGVGCYIHRSLIYDKLDELSIFHPRVFESQFIKVKMPKNKFLIIGNIYRPNTAPFADIERANTYIEQILIKIKTDPMYKNAQDLILTGDFNINILNHKNHKETGRYIDTLLSNGLLPLITLPTRISNKSATIIDHISTNIKDDSYDAGIILADISDHFPIFYIKHDNVKLKDPKVGEPVKKRKIDIESMSEFRNSLENIDWDPILSNQNANEAFDLFFENIDVTFERHFPEKPIKFSKNNFKHNPWMTNAILNSRKKKEKLFRKKIKCPTNENKQLFRNYNSAYTKIVRAARKKYYTDKFEQYSKDCKKTWENINEVLGRKKGNVDIPKIFHSNGKVISGNFEIAEGFNEFFVNIGPKLAKSIPNSSRPFSDYLSNPVKENFVFSNMRPDIILEALKKLKNKKSSGHDKISSNLLKFIIPSIMGPICHLFDLSFKTGFIPMQLKTAKIVPIYKSGQTDIFTNYRPISLLSSFSKLLEKVAANQMLRFLNKFNILYEHQYGFRSNHSTIHPVLHFLRNVYKALNQPEPEFTLGIFIDLTKAFDTCDINILLHKLYHYGFREESNPWFHSYLTGRQQFTSINGVNSSKKDITCGVPQGSILGPLLFILLINDLPNSSSFSTLLFADDTTLQISGPNLIELYTKANHELEKVSEWFKANKLTLNAKKTKYICFKSNSRKDNIEFPSLKIDNTKIDRIGEGCKEEYFKFVGIRIDEKMSWKYHLEYVAKKASSAAFALAKTKNLLPSNVKLLIYNALFRSYIEYGLIVWGHASNYLKKKIFISQKKALRYIDNAKRLAHSEPLFKKYSILKFKDLLEFNQAAFMYRYTYKLLPKSFDDFFVKLLHFERSLNYKTETCKNRYLKNYTSVTLPLSWNHIAIDLKRCKSFKYFKIKLSQNMLSNYTMHCTRAKCKSCDK